ncbi:MAG: undecaprenyl-phosphate glucose phosphotransferase [Cyclobacteriaceae bacterium]
MSIGFVIAYLFKFGDLVIGYHYYSLLFGLNTLWLLTFFSAKLHRVNREDGLIQQLNQLLTALVLNLAIIFALWFIFTPDYLSRQQLFFTYIIFTSNSILWRAFWYFLVRYYRAKGYNYRRLVVVGHSEISSKLVKYFQQNPTFGYKFLGYFDSKKSTSETLGNLNDLENYVLTNRVDFIYAYLPSLLPSQMKRLMDFAENHMVKVKILSQYTSLGYQNLNIQNYGNIPVINITAIPLDHKINQIVKRSFDIIFSGFVIITIISWLVPLVGILIKLESSGPIFFRQERTGLGDKKFSILKFRTMRVHDDSKVKQATRNDSRITRLGGILRRTSIDEFPQFINVFQGDMSVVGPRPHAVKHNEEFKKKIDRFVQRHAMKPGITGLAQAKGFRGETNTFNDISGRVRLDRFYVKNWSIFLDFKIILLTIISILKGSDKAY